MGRRMNKVKLKAVSVDEMQRIDRLATQKYGIPEIVLMENAGLRVTEIALQMLSRLDGKKVEIFCGRGNNGGDGFVVARHLINRGLDVDIYLMGELNAVKSSALTNLQILLKMGKGVEEITDKDILTRIEKKLKSTHLIIDALFGTGIKGQIKDPEKTLIQLLNKSRKPILSVDIPSGLSADSGEVLGGAIKATKTVTFALAKKGFFQGQGPDYTGELIVADIGIPLQLLQQKDIWYNK